MKTSFVIFAVVSVLCGGFTSLQGNGFATAQDSSSFEVFLRNGFHALTGVSTTKTALGAIDEKCMDTKKVYEVTCNGTPLDTDSCVGRTIVNVTDTCGNDVRYYTRMCDGEFVNQTKPYEGNIIKYKMDTVQTCYGKSFVTMKLMKKDASSGEWKNTFFYSKTCFTKYEIMQDFSDGLIFGRLFFEIQTQCNTASETMTVKPEKDADDSDLKGAIVTCNYEEADINEPCEGQFKIVTNKMMKPLRNKNGKDKMKKNKKGSKKGSSPSPSPSPAAEPAVTPSEAPLLSPVESSPSPKPLVQSMSPSIAKSRTNIGEKPVAPPLATSVSSPESAPVVSREVLPSPAVQTEPSASEEVESPFIIEEESVIDSETTKEKKKRIWTFTCEGKWKPYGSAYYECVGKIVETVKLSYYKNTETYQCTGTFGRSTFEGKKDEYKICNGKSEFDDIVSFFWHFMSSNSKFGQDFGTST